MKKLFIQLFILLIAINLEGQDFYGKAFYSTDAASKITFDSGSEQKDSLQSTDNTDKKITLDEQALNEKIRKAMQKEYELLFNKTESIYKEVPKLNGVGNGKEMEVVGLGGGSEGGLYKDIRNMKYKENRDVFGKLFLVQDELEKLDWTLENETKTIGAYTCYKATAVKESKRPDFMKKDSEGNPAEIVVKTTITAWYTPQIPISQGPAQYWGLPGFILEVNDGRTHISCSRIVLNPEEEIKIKAPCKGKKTDQTSFKEIYNEKIAEMVKMSESNRKKDKS